MANDKEIKKFAVEVPEGVTVIINGEERAEFCAPYGTEIEWSVSATGFVSQSGSFVLEEDKTLDVELLREIYTVKINAVPEGATVIMNGVEGNEQSFKYGTTINWEVHDEAEHYVTKTGTLEVTENIEFEVDLSLETYTVKIDTVPEGATVVMNGVEGNEQTFDYGTVVNYEVSAEHYVGKSGKITVTEDTEFTVELELEEHCVTINVTLEEL